MGFPGKSLSFVVGTNAQNKESLGVMGGDGVEVICPMQTRGSTHPLFRFYISQGNEEGPRGIGGGETETG